MPRALQTPQVPVPAAVPVDIMQIEPFCSAATQQRATEKTPEHRNFLKNSALADNFCPHLHLGLIKIPVASLYSFTFSLSLLPFPLIQLDDFVSTPSDTASARTSSFSITAIC
jgi:hypothetical protein